MKPQNQILGSLLLGAGLLLLPLSAVAERGARGGGIASLTVEGEGSTTTAEFQVIEQGEGVQIPPTNCPQNCWREMKCYKLTRELDEGPRSKEDSPSNAFTNVSKRNYGKLAPTMQSVSPPNRLSTPEVMNKYISSFGAPIGFGQEKPFLTARTFDKTSGFQHTFKHDSWKGSVSACQGAEGTTSVVCPGAVCTGGISVIQAEAFDN